ncbi:DMT family transporter [Actinomadura verrucosospora]|uniref:DMT(Drug/metabolite transporter) superfamily permease n=1 Tax=Actinomadura verrucosospora TaxID=46165 RepID=A0A7D4AS40_ACTVE|nr:DMT family transporter [Actinomadura verrucosospora]QKG23709.1 DMT(drug/metabolite transporter) superfamily permease [Actinomadura verrucosospora]
MSRRGWLLFALMSVLWGIPYLMIKVAVGGVSVPVLVFARTALGALVLVPIAVRSGGLEPVRRHWRPLLAFTAMEILGPWALLSDAEHRLTSSMTGLLIAAVPIIGVVLARLSGDAERLGPVRWAGLLVGLAGVGVLAGPHLGGGSAWAIGEVMLVALGYSIAPMIATRRLQDLPSLHMAAGALTIAALVYAIPAALTWPDAVPAGRVLAALGGLGLVCTALAFIVFFELIREAGTSRAMVFTYVNPAVAVVAGVLLLDEPLTGTIIASFALILGGSVLATARPGGGGSPAAAETPAADVPAADVPGADVPVSEESR